ncbi:MAG TPA: hypothetical protein VNJ05_00810 [Sphingomicrobium sp.]|nr:hypothetical protein [Sphingomicrobium sp.]
MRVLVLVLALAGCAQPGTPSDTAAFTRELAGRVAGKPQTCISTMPSQNLRVIDGQTLAYDQGRTLWVNKLAARCPAIEPLNTVIVEPKLGSQYCRGDHIRGLEPGAIIPGPTCFLGEWTPYRSAQ